MLKRCEEKEELRHEVWLWFVDWGSADSAERLAIHVAINVLFGRLDPGLFGNVDTLATSVIVWINLVQLLSAEHRCNSPL